MSRKSRRNSHNSSKKKSIYIRIANRCLLVSVICLGIYYGIYKLNTMLGSNLEYGDNILEEEMYASVEKKDEVNLLFAGTDESGLRTDSIMFMKYDTVHNRLYIMSIPRDTYSTNIYAHKKMNNIYTGGKHVDALVDEVETMLDTNIDYYCVMDLDLISEVVNSIGGLEIDIKEEVWKRDKKTKEWYLFLKPGKQTLNAKQVEKLVRNRDYSEGDIEREKVQREVMVVLIENIMKTKNILKLPSIVKKVVSNTNTDIETREALAYAAEIREIDTKNVLSTVMPWEYYTLNGVSYVKVDTEKASKIIKEKWVYNEQVATN